MAYSDLGERYRHAVGVNERVLDSKAVINYVDGAMKRYAEHVEDLAVAKCSPASFVKAVEKIYNKEYSKLRHIETLNNLFYHGAGNEGKTFYDAFNAITDYSSNRSRRDTAGRFYYANFGTGSGVNQRAMRVLTELAAV
jgi:hypothetical protein